MRTKLEQLLMTSRNVRKDAFFWNSFCACLNSFQTMLLLLVLTRFGNDNDSSIFVMAYVVGNLMLYIGRYGTRQFQVTDAKEKYAFSEYVRGRVCSMALFAVATAAYLAWGVIGKAYAADKTVVVALICLYKGIEAAEDVLHGRMQQMGRLDVGAKILTIRFLVFISGYAACYILTRDLILTSAVNVAVTAGLCLLLNGAVYRNFLPQEEQGRKTGRFQIPWALLWECLPLALSTVLSFYLHNAPKYTVDGAVSDAVQTCFNIVFMPAFVVGLLSNFIFNPTLKKMGTLWTAGDISGLRRVAVRLTLVPIAIDALVTLVGAYLGPPILSKIYAVDVRPYTPELVVLLISSGFIGLQYLYTMLLTTIRRQKHLLGSYAAGAVVLVTCGGAVLRAGLLQLCLLHLAVLAAVLLYCLAVFFVCLGRERRAPADVWTE